MVPIPTGMAEIGPGHYRALFGVMSLDVEEAQGPLFERALAFLNPRNWESGKRIEITSTEAVTIDGFPGLLTHLRMFDDEPELGRWIAVFGDARAHVDLIGTYVLGLEVSPVNKQRLRDAILSARWQGRARYAAPYGRLAYDPGGLATTSVALEGTRLKMRVLRGCFPSAPKQGCGRLDEYLVIRPHEAKDSFTAGASWFQFPEPDSELVPVSVEEVKVDGYDGVLIHATDTGIADPAAVWILVFGDHQEAAVIKGWYRADRDDLRALVRTAVLSTTWARQRPPPPGGDVPVYMFGGSPRIAVKIDARGRLHLTVGDGEGAAVSEQQLLRRLQRERGKFKKVSIGWHPQAPMHLRDRILDRARSLGFEADEWKDRILVNLELLAGNRVSIDGVVVANVDVVRNLRELRDDDHRIELHNRGGSSAVADRLHDAASRAGWFR